MNLMHNQQGAPLCKINHRSAPWSQVFITLIALMYKYYIHAIIFNVRGAPVVVIVW